MGKTGCPTPPLAEQVCRSSPGQKCVGSAVRDKLHCNLLNLHVKLITPKPLSQLPFLLLSLLTYFPGFIFSPPQQMCSLLAASFAEHSAAPAAVFTHSLRACVLVFANLDSEPENTALRGICIRSLGSVFVVLSSSA